MSLLFSAAGWGVVREDDWRMHWLRRDHYSVANKSPKQARLGPGEKVCLLSACHRAIIVWQHQRVGALAGKTYCPIFRNVGAALSSDLLLSAEAFIPAHFPRALITFVDGAAVRGDGKCFKVAGWRRAGRTQERRLIILEKHIGGRK